MLGASSVDESTITGEPLPKDKTRATKSSPERSICREYLEARVFEDGEKDTTLAKIIETTFAATKTKGGRRNSSKLFAGYYTPSIIVIAALLVTVPTLFAQPFNPWFEQAITILVIALSVRARDLDTDFDLRGNRQRFGTKGALVKAANAMKPSDASKPSQWTNTHPDLRQTESNRCHFRSAKPHANICWRVRAELLIRNILWQRAIVAAANAENINLHPSQNFQAVMGKGTKSRCAVCYDKHHCIGKLPFITEEHSVQDEIVSQVEELQRTRKNIGCYQQPTIRFEGVVALTDEIKNRKPRGGCRINRLA